MIKKFFFALFVLFLLAKSQDNLVDGIAAIVGEHIILKSDVAQLTQMTAIQQNLDPRFDSERLETLQNSIVTSLINQKIILEVAEEESIVVEDREVEQSVEQYIAQSVAQAGSEESLENMLGKSVSELRREWWEEMREQLITEKYQAQFFGNSKITKDEVVVFYNNYKDSLSFIPTSYNVSHLFFKIVPGEKSRSLAYNLADSLRGLLSNGDDFSKIAQAFSDDPGSKSKGGELGFVGRGTFVPSFEQAAYNLDIMEISPVIESDFGFHIIQLLGKLGDKINTRHILITPKISFEDEETIYNFALNVKDSINTFTDFGFFANKYSDDLSTKNINGSLGWINKDDFSNKDLMSVIPSLELKKCSVPINTGDGVHLLYVNDIKPGGIPNLKNNWSFIEQLALNKKKIDLFNKMIKQKSESYFIKSFVN
tara:strand:- start:125 stop:1402 length:1278 start_codon:yes stop_codon:yes gene_type:complete